MKKSTRALFEYKTVKQRGGHKSRNALLEVRASHIYGADNGVFALLSLQKDDHITWYGGEQVNTPSAS